MEIQLKEGGTNLRKTFREYNLVFKGLIVVSMAPMHGTVAGLWGP